MPNNFVLLTLEYPPQVGGIARYLSGLVEASQGAIEVVNLPPTSRWWSLVRLCRAQKGKTILVSHVFPVGTAAWIAKRFFGGPDYVVIFHGTDLRQVQSPFRQTLLWAICRAAKALVVNSHTTQKQFDALIPLMRSIVILPAVEKVQMPSREAARATLGLDAARHVIVSIARLVPRKGIDVALQALAQLQAKRDVTYAIIGSGPDEERLMQIAKDCGVKVEWISNASDEVKWSWLAASDVFLLPGRAEGRDIEGFGIVFLEAAQAGLPSVAGRSGGASEAVVDGETGILVDPQDVQDITRALEKLLDLSELRKEMGEVGRQRVEREFRWLDRWKQLEAIL